LAVLKQDNPKRATTSGKELQQQTSFMPEQPLLAPEPTAIADQPPVPADDAMTGHDDRDRVLAIGRAHRPHCARVAQPVGDILVGDRGAIRNGQQLPPDLLLKLGADQVQRQVENLAMAGEVFLNLNDGALDDGRRKRAATSRFDEIERRNGAAIPTDLDQTDRRFIGIFSIFRGKSRQTKRKQGANKNQTEQ